MEKSGDSETPSGLFCSDRVSSSCLNGRELDNASSIFGISGLPSSVNADSASGSLPFLRICCLGEGLLLDCSSLSISGVESSS